METEQNLTEVEVNGEENIADYYVPYIDNGFILKHLDKEGNANTARMLLSLPLCRTNNETRMAGCLSRLKNKKTSLNKKKSAEGVTAFKAFLDAEFVFPEPSGEVR